MVDARFGNGGLAFRLRQDEGTLQHGLGANREAFGRPRRADVSVFGRALSLTSYLIAHSNRLQNATLRELDCYVIPREINLLRFPFSLWYGWHRYDGTLSDISG
jgi:hypothetical protein